MDKNYLITKANFFIMNCSYDLTLEEQKIILTLASLVEPTDEEFKPYIFKIADFIEILGVSNQAKYNEIPKITKNLMKKVFEIQEGDTLLQVAWLSSAQYQKGSGVVTLKFSPDLKPYMLKLNSMFTQYKLANILSMKSKYSPRIYELLKCNQFLKQGYIEIELMELRKLLKAENIYPRYFDFKKNVLEATKKELRELTDINYTYEEQRFGRKVTVIRFYIYKNNCANEPNNIAEKENIESMVKIMAEHKISHKEAKKIYLSAAGNMEQIIKVYEYCKDKAANNFVGLMVHMVKPGKFIDPKRNIKKNNFNNFKARDYDYEELERKLLGWDREE